MFDGWHCVTRLRAKRVAGARQGECARRQRLRRTLELSALTLLWLCLFGRGWAAEREPIRLWFWGAPPNLQEALRQALVEPFNASQSRYTLEVEYRNTVDSDVRVSVMAGQGPDLIFTSGPAYIARFAKAGMLEPLNRYVSRYRWDERLLTQVTSSCKLGGQVYCVVPAVVTDGMFYNKAVLKEHGWSVPTRKDQLVEIMNAAQKLGMYASVTGNKGWQPVNEDYASLFVNQVAGPMGFYDVLTGATPWDSAAMRRAIEESARWFRAGYLGGHDYFSLNFDQALALLHSHRTPFFFAPSFAYQWATNYFKGAEAGDLGFAPFPNIAADVPYPTYDIGVGFTLSINAESQVKDGAAAVLDRIQSADFVRAISRGWPGYWAVPLRNFPNDPDADPIAATYYAATIQIMQAIRQGRFGFKIQTFCPPATTNVFIDELESVWLGKMTAEALLKKAGQAFEREKARQIVVVPSRPTFSR
jgi:raffinose/stachyose/melibiose transport system substrate-binding protein